MFANNTEYLHNLVLFFLASYCQTRPKNTFALPVDRPVVGQTRALSPSLYNENNETLKWRKRMKKYHDTVTTGLKANSPSVGANPENFLRDQQMNPILNGRPLANTGPPITIYNSAFSLFLNNFSDENLEIPPDFLGWADKLILNATKINEYEEERNERMREILSEKLGTILLVEYKKKNRQKCKSDGVLTTSLDTLIAYLGILEGKNEIETDKNDPTIQEALYYRDYWSQDNLKKIRNCCCVPSFIITVAGPWFYILGGVFLNRAVWRDRGQCISSFIEDG
ncbi:unnamed protein product [Rhizophagus irregularis]|nr:unnamed protein product [Rhizophagus irregularis]